jgi:hypothetical protein
MEKHTRSIDDCDMHNGVFRYQAIPPTKLHN